MFSTSKNVGEAVRRALWACDVIERSAPGLTCQEAAWVASHSPSYPVAVLPSALRAGSSRLCCFWPNRKGLCWKHRSDVSSLQLDLPVPIGVRVGSWVQSVTWKEKLIEKHAGSKAPVSAHAGFFQDWPYGMPRCGFCHGTVGLSASSCPPTGCRCQGFSRAPLGICVTLREVLSGFRLTNVNAMCCLRQWGQLLIPVEWERVGRRRACSACQQSFASGCKGSLCFEKDLGET